MKKLLLLIIFSVSLAFTPKVKAVDLGPFNVTLGFCSQVNKLSSILQSYTIVQWPVTGVPGITMGMMSNTSVILDFCNYLTTLESLDTVNAIQFSAQYLNQLTNKKWDDNFQQIDRMWNITNTLYDSETGTYRQGALESASTHREINDFVKGSADWYSQKFNGTDSDIKTRSEREAQVNELAKISYQRSIIKEMTNCPETSTDINYAELYSKQVKPLEKIRDEAQEDMEFFREKLYDMGSRFNGTQAEAQDYYSQLEKIPVLGVAYESTSTKGSKSTYKPKKSGKAVTQEKKSIDIVVQKWSAKPSEDIVTAFKNNFGDKWKTWVTAQWVSQGSYGILDDPSARVESEFKDISGECNKNRIARRLDDKKASFEKDLETEFKRCTENIKVDQKTTENLLSYYATKYYNAIYSFKQQNAQIWTFESKYLGRNRNVSRNSGSDNYQQEEVKCEANLQPIEMEKMKLKLQSLENDLNQQIATETFKQTVMMQDEKKKQDDLSKEAASRRRFTEAKAAKDRRELSAGGTMLTPPRGIPGSASGSKYKVNIPK